MRAALFRESLDEAQSIRPQNSIHQLSLSLTPVLFGFEKLEAPDLLHST
jgi:hypothetical protein